MTLSLLAFRLFLIKRRGALDLAFALALFATPSNPSTSTLAITCTIDRLGYICWQPKTNGLLLQVHGGGSTSIPLHGKGEGRE